MQARRSSLWGVAAGTLLALPGCTARPALPQTFPAGGSVAYKSGEALKGGAVEFASTSDPLLRVLADIGGDGTFKLVTKKDNAQANGAPAGEYKVTVRLPAGDARDPIAAQKGAAAAPVTLAKTYKVEAKDNNFSLVLDVPAPRP